MPKAGNLNKMTNFGRCCRPFSREVTLLLISCALLYNVQWCLFSSLTFYLTDHSDSNLQSAFTYAYYASWALLPVAGWIAESWIGRYKAIVGGMVLCSITVILALLAFIMLTFNWTLPAFVLMIIALFNGIIGFGSFYTIMLPFTLDQMIGASAEELSAAAQWYYWCFFVPPLIKNALPCLSFSTELQQISYFLPVVFLILSSLSFSAALVLDCLFYKWLDTQNKTGNPMKLIYQVLNYARKNKCPRRRSALTYIDEEHPSRIDFGKRKFGGPFTEEEVEDVKTVFRLIPILFVSVFGAFLTLDLYDQLSLHAIPTTDQTLFCVQNLKSTLSYAAAFMLIPVYRFIFRPLISRYIPSMLAVMAAGLCLCIAVTVIELDIMSIGHFYSNASYCVFDDDLTDKGTLFISPLYLVVVINFINGVGVVLIMCSLFEFVVAQAPNRMRGIMMGLMMTGIGIGILTSYFLAQIFQYFQTASPSCVFYYYLVLSLLLLLILIVFVILAKRYKLRERERHVNIQAIVEEYNERYFEQEDEYRREVAGKNPVCMSESYQHCAVKQNP